MALRSTLRNVLMTGGVLFYALPVLAAESEEAKPGLPQFDTSLFPEQLFWLALSFGLLYLLMHFVALPGVSRTQSKRQSLIASELAAASKANDDAKAMIVQYEKALADARSKAHATVSEIATEAAAESISKQGAQQKELAHHLHQAEAKIKAARDAALEDIHGAASELSAAIVDKVAGFKMQVRA